VAVVAGCKAKADGSGAPTVSTAAASPQQAGAQQAADDAPPAEKTGGFDGKRAFAHVVKQVGFGPRPSGSAAIVQLQEYIQGELTSYGCKVDVDAFSADTPVGRLPMKNLVAKIPGDKPGIIMLATHYDTKRLGNFVGADDGGSSTGVMVELARLLCPRHSPYAVWIVFFDGEEAVKDWSETDSRYGSRQMAAKMGMSGELSKVKAFLLADIVGTRALRFKRGDKYHARFWGQVVRFLTLSRMMGGNKRVQLQTDRTAYQAHDRMQIFATVVNEAYEPVQSQNYTVYVERAGEPDKTVAVKLDVVPQKAGFFQGAYIPEDDGRYLIRPSNEEVASANKLEVEVSTIPIEQREPAMQERVLKELAQISGGRYFAIKELPQLPKALKKEERSTTVRMEKELFDLPVVFVLIVLLGGAEWFIRRRHDLA